MSVSLKEVKTSSDLKKFIDFPHDLYQEDPNYVPELHIAVKEHLSPKKNPYFKHSEATSFLAYRDGKIVGRISCTLNNNYNQYHNCNVGFFGFFETINDSEVASILLQKAESYCKEKGLDKVIGPTNLTTNDTAGILVNGFDSSPMVQMTYNKPYYAKLLEANGFKKEMDLFAYKIDSSNVNKKAIRLSNAFEQRLKKAGVTFRAINMKKFKSEVNNIREIYRSAWEKNWGFVPPTNEEFDFLAEGLKLIVNPDYAYLAEHEGDLIGFGLALPNINEILIKIKKGRLLPTGIFKLLFGKNKTKSIRIILLGIREEFRKKGIEAVMFANFIEKAMENNLEYGEASWILDNNTMMIQAAENLNGERYKTYRIYSKAL
jgi:GNAT superfamily N-acetyltransferase